MEKMNYSKVYSSAINAYSHSVNGNMKILDSMASYYREGQKSPAIAHMIFRDSFTHCTEQLVKELGEMGYNREQMGEVVSNVLTNIDNTSCAEPVKSALHKFVKAWEDFYPRTKLIRQYMIENDWVVMDENTRTKSEDMKNMLREFIRG